MNEPNTPLSNLYEQAKKALERAYAPYSKYPVGAALLTQEGKIFTGCNIENVSYGLTVCAERVAVFQAVSQGYRNFTAMAVVVRGEEIARPCGACRQVLLEFSPGISLYLANDAGKIEEFSLKDLLPLSFLPRFLKE